MTGAVSGLTANPGDLVEICECDHVADWHHRLTSTGQPVYAQPNGSITRCPNYRCDCKAVRRAYTRPLARIPTPWTH